MGKKAKIRPYRKFSEEFKKLRVQEYESGEYSVCEISRIFKVSTTSLYSWIYKYSTYHKKKSIIVETKDSSTKRLKDYERRIKELERIVGQKQIKLDFYEKMFQIGSDELGIDLKKKFKYKAITEFRIIRHHLGYSLRSLYNAIGISESAVSQYYKRAKMREKHMIELLDKVRKYKERHPGCGLKKMYYQLNPMHIGRDKFIQVMQEHGYIKMSRKNKLRTTLPGCYRWPNYISGKIVTGINEVWQSDITYFIIGKDVYYITFIMDVYSRLILSYNVSNTLHARSNLLCLKRAIKLRGKQNVIGIIHHSDRGSQYTSTEYLITLQNHEFIISMGYIAQDNAYAERLNGIIKHEYLYHREINNLSQLRKWTKQAVDQYNSERIHDSLPDRMSPIQFEKELVNLDYQRRPKVIIYADGNKEIKDAKGFLDTLPKKDLQAHICPIMC